MPSNTLFAIGDIQGCHQKLATLLSRLPFDKSADTLIFLGDYINRGPDSRKVLDALLELGETCAHVVFLMGNHEQALLEYAQTGEVEDLGLLRVMGVDATAASYGASLRRLIDLSCMPAEHQRFLRNLRFSHATDDYLFTHADCTEPAPVPPGGSTIEALHAQRCCQATLLSSRRLGREAACCSGRRVVFGHIPYASPLVRPDRIGIDTGAVFGNLLTAVELPALRFHHA